MSVLITLIAAITTAALGLTGGILLGTGCVRWYGISSFEGGSGYFVILIGLLGGIGGFVVGIGVPLYCILAETRFAGWSACLVSWATAVSILLVAAALAWLLAPPRERPDPMTAATPSAPAELPSRPALPDDASLDELLLALANAAEPATKTALAERIAKSPDFPALIERIVSDDPNAAARAIRSMTSLAMEPAQTLHLLSIAGNDIGDRLDRVVATTTDADPGYRGAADISIRFSAWFDVAFSLRATSANDVNERLGPQLIRFLEASRLRPDSVALRHDVCRVASYYASQWLGVVPAAGDPPPR